jgi:hypothetical protein
MPSVSATLFADVRRRLHHHLAPADHQHHVIRQQHHVRTRLKRRAGERVFVIAGDRVMAPRAQ